MKTQKVLGDLLVNAGVIDAAGLDRALEAQARTPTTLGRALAKLGLATESAVAAAIATALRLECLDGELPDVEPAISALLPGAFCRKRGVALLSLSGKTLRVATTNPADDSILQDVQFRTLKWTVPVVVTETWLDSLLSRLYPEADPGLNYDMLESSKPEGEVEAAADREYDLVDPAVLAKDLQLAPVVKLVNLILTDAARAGASDVHIEPHEDKVQIRQRVDGLLYDVLTVPRHLQDATISRIKIMAGMDISERRKPQDGRSRLRLEGSRIDLRVSTMPMQFGEKIVIRLLRTDKAVLTLDRLVVSIENLRLFRKFLGKPQGMILVTGPTGSGKTSTLYAAVSALKTSTNNIITLEDPIEMQLPGVNQMQVNVKAGVTFASGLRSILRQDPNVILVGEIRDPETAEIALAAAQTGHLLLSTLHTNDAVATISRLYDLGVQPFMIATSLLGIVAQRLVRRVCPVCSTERHPDSETIEKAGGASRLPAAGSWRAGRGCDQCDQSGFKGRIAVHEVLAVNDEIRELISTRATESTLKRAAQRAGMKTLFEDGLDQAARGLTTLEEVLRVVPPDAAADDPREALLEIAPIEANRGTAIEADKGAAGGRVLVVEDSITVATVLKYFLELEGFEVLLAADGAIGLETALRERPDLIVTDVNMPGMGGVEMVKALRANPRTALTRILMLTSEASVESEAEGLAAGADDYLVKPVEPRRLAARVKALRARSPLVAALEHVSST